MTQHAPRIPNQAPVLRTIKPYHRHHSKHRRNAGKAGSALRCAACHYSLCRCKPCVKGEEK